MDQLSIQKIHNVLRKDNGSNQTKLGCDKYATICVKNASIFTNCNVNFITVENKPFRVTKKWKLVV